MKNIITTLAMIIIVVNISLADVKLEFKNYDKGNESQSEVNTAIFTPDKLKIESKNKNGKVTIIFNASKEKVIIIMDEEKSYMVMGREMIENIGKQMEGAMAQMKQQFANLPEAQRKQMEKMMSAQMGGVSVTYTVDKTGETKKINNWNTTKYNLKADNEIKSEIWAAPFKSVGINESDMAVMKSFSDFMNKMVKSIPMAQKDPFSAMYDEFNGIPVKTINTTDNSVNELVSVEEYNATDSDFAIPSGYTEKKLPTSGGR
jgi:DNA-binding protein YbaB